ncbi:hypothetical protein V6R21_23745 [Limibacter armeniacum]|uniref:hypothetical protein n=1 Tax=Limibacter armeniacum TaxID=466084 RepID=UPI002FE58F29
MTKRIAHWFSILTHPLFVPLAMGFILVFASQGGMWLPIKGKLMLMALIAIFSVVFPSGWIFMLHRFGFVHSLYMEQREERTLPLLVMLLSSALLTFMLFVKLKISFMISTSFLSITVLLLLANIMNAYHKISLHALGLGGLLGILLAIRKVQESGTESLSWWIILTTLLLGACMTSRLILKAHNQQEVYGGAVIGIIGGYLASIFGWWLVNNLII